MEYDVHYETGTQQQRPVSHFGVPGTFAVGNRVDCYCLITVLKGARMQKLLKVLGLMLLLLSFAVTAFGQTETGQITGTVKDKSGAVVPNAKVTLIAVETNTTRTALTSAAGLYNFPSLKPATYKVIVEAAGFEKFERQITVNVASNVEVSAQLTVGSSTTVVEVSATSADIAVNTENQTISTVINTGDLENLPTDSNRNPYALVQLSTNANVDSNSNRGAGFSLNGERSASTSILLDGAENVDAYTASVGQPVPLDSVQEFSVLTSNFGAEFGRASGGVVNLVTKSGTNHLHGSVYEFNRVAALSSNTYYNDVNDIKKGEYTRNNFGFSVGGPIIKNKLFFFENLEWLRVRSNGSVSGEVIDPTSYSALSLPAQTFFSTQKLSPNVKVNGTNSCNATGTVLQGSGLTCDLINYSVPTDAGGGAPENTWDEVGKIDYNLSSKTTFTARYAAYKEVDTAGYESNSPYAGYNTGQTLHDQNMALSLTHIFTPSVISSSKIVYNRLLTLQPLGTAPTGPTLYTTGTVPVVPGTSQSLVFPGYLNNSPGNAIPFGGPQNLYQFYQDVSTTFRKHQIKFGAQFIQLRDNRIFGAYENAVEELGTTYNDGMTNLLAGNAYLFEGAIAPQGKFPCSKSIATGAYIQTPDCTLTTPVGEPSFSRNYQYNDGALYAQDSWKVTSRLTINAGLRWEYYGVQHNSDPSLDSNFVMGPGSNPWDRIRNGSVQLRRNGGVFYKPDYKNFAPRFGFAWDPTGKGKTSIRAGYSIGYERNFGNVTYNAIQNPPNYAVVSIQGEGADVPVLPLYTTNQGPLAGSGTSVIFPNVSLRAINQNMKTAYAESFNFGIEQSVFNNALVSISYAGSHGVHEYSISNANVNGDGQLYLGDARGANRLNMQYSNMNYRSDDAYNHYNALVTSFKANNIHKSGVNLYSTYQWSHTLDNLSSTFSDGVGTLYAATGYLDTWNPKLNYGNADYDIRHRFLASASWELPWAKNSANAITRNTLGGWVLAGTYNLHSGNPFTIWDCNNQVYDCAFYTPGAGAPKVPKGSVGAAVPGAAGLFNYISLPVNPNPSPYVTSKTYPGGVPGLAWGAGNALGLPSCTGLLHVGCTYTNDGTRVPDRNQFRGPSVYNLDAQVLKNFKFGEKVGAQFRAEVYNLFNHHNQYIYAYNLDVSGTNNIQTAKGANTGNPGLPTDDHRNVDLGLKITF
jgi:outer membrane receptor protein involved in Fe transport